MDRKLMYDCWRLGLRTNKIIEYFGDRGIYITEYDTEPLFKSVVKEYFEYRKTLCKPLQEDFYKK